MYRYYAWVFWVAWVGGVVCTIAVIQLARVGSKPKGLCGHLYRLLCMDVNIFAIGWRRAIGLRRRLAGWLISMADHIVRQGREE